MTGLVREAVRQEFSLSAMRLKDLTEVSNREAETAKKECNSQLAALDRKIEELTKSGSERYLKYRKGELSEGVFLKEKEELGQRRALLQKQRLDATERLRTIEVQTAEKNHFLRALARGRGKAELTAEVLETLIHRIEVYPDHRIKVIFAFKRSDFTGGLQG